jgi:hypothetical protein
VRADEDDACGAARRPGDRDEAVEPGRDELDVRASAIGLRADATNDPRLLEHSKVVGQEVARDAKVLGKRPRGAVGRDHGIHHGQADRVGQRLKSREPTAHRCFSRH